MPRLYQKRRAHTFFYAQTDHGWCKINFHFWEDYSRIQSYMSNILLYVCNISIYLMVNMMDTWEEKCCADFSRFTPVHALFTTAQHTNTQYFNFSRFWPLVRDRFLLNDGSLRIDKKEWAKEGVSSTTIWRHHTFRQDTVVDL